MAHTLDPYGKPNFDDVYSFPGDSQANADFADTFAWTRGGTAAGRLALLPGQMRDGMAYVETDTGEVYDRALGDWVRRRRVDAGRFDGSTNATGYVTVNHGLRTTPVSVTATMSVGSPIIPRRLKAVVENITTSSFRVQILRNDSADEPFASNAVQFYWTAVA